jgi:hypothetical protein
MNNPLAYIEVQSFDSWYKTSIPAATKEHAHECLESHLNNIREEDEIDSALISLLKRF